MLGAAPNNNEQPGALDLKLLERRLVMFLSSTAETQVGAAIRNSESRDEKAEKAISVFNIAKGMFCRVDLIACEGHFAPSADAVGG